MADDPEVIGTPPSNNDQDQLQTVVPEIGAFPYLVYDFKLNFLSRDG